MKYLPVTKIIKENNFEGVWDELEAEHISRDHHSENFWDWLWFSCQTVHCEKNLISVSEDILVVLRKF